MSETDLDINSYTGNLVFWCPDCGLMYSSEDDIEICLGCSYDGDSGWDACPPQDNKGKGRNTK